MNLKLGAAALLLGLAGQALSTPVVPPSKVTQQPGSTQFEYPVKVDGQAPLVIIVPDTTLPTPRVTIINRPAVTPPPVKITGSLEGAVLPGGVKSAQEALKVWPFATLLEKANMVFMAPETIKLEKSSEVTLTFDLSKDETIEKELAAINKLGEKIEINRVVVARILAPDFDVIEVVKDGRQVLDLKSPNEWRWTITPRKLGAYKVNVTVSAVVEIGADRAERLIKVYDQEVTVFVTAADAARYFFTRNWQWLWSTLILPFGVWYWKNRRKKAGEQENGE
jgi:hypothetical protein